jgi:hypothetical protein
MKGESTMPRTLKSRAVRSISQYHAEDYIWGIPESPEFSVVHHLMNEFKTHENDEERWLSVYKESAEAADDPVIRFLLNMIVTDEERHHQILARTMASLKDDLASTRAGERPAKTAASAAAARELAVIVERFLDVERKGIRECEKLKKTTQRFRQGLLALFCETMIYDSLKHIAILKFLRTKLKQQRAPGRESKPPRDG